MTVKPSPLVCSFGQLPQLNGWMWGFESPAVLEQRLQYSFFVSGPDLLLVSHLAHQLLCDAGEGLLLTVEYCHTLIRENKGFRRQTENLVKVALKDYCGEHAFERISWPFLILIRQ